MGGDYPDWTDLLQLVGSDIMVPIDIQASYVMLPVDIQAQYVTLEIDIVAQTVGNIAIDLAAQSIGNLAVDINAQTIGNLVIDIEAQSIGLYLQPEWASKEGVDKNFYFFTNNLEPQLDAGANYTPPAYKTLFICQLSFSLCADKVADADKNQIGVGIIDNVSDSLRLIRLGGNGGGGITFTKPFAIPGGKQMWYGGFNYSAHTCNLGVAVHGYEI